MSYSVGEKVIYSSLGVCEISETAAHVEALNSNELYYVLNPLNSRLGKAYVPHSKEEAIKAVVTPEQAQEIIDAFSKAEADDYKDSNSRLVEDHFKQLIKTNDCFNNLIVIKSMVLRIQEQKEKGSSPSSTYMRLLDDAKKRAYGQLAIALDKSIEDIAELIEALI